jgi:hypothetical protein
MSIQATALARAIAFLKVAGTPYAVLDQEGNLHTSGGYEFHKIPEPKTKVAGDRKKTVLRGTYSNIYRPVMELMQPGDTRVIAATPEVERIDWFQASLGSWANSHWGAETYLTEMDNVARTVTIARIV